MHNKNRISNKIVTVVCVILLLMFSQNTAYANGPNWGDLVLLGFAFVIFLLLNVLLECLIAIILLHITHNSIKHVLSVLFVNIVSYPIFYFASGATLFSSGSFINKIFIITFLEITVVICEGFGIYLTSKSIKPSISGKTSFSLSVICNSASLLFITIVYFAIKSI